MEARVPLDRTNLPLLAWPLVSLCLSSLASPALAADPTKDECITDNENGQRLQKEGKLREAKEHLQVCLASSCPKLVRDDCADRLRAVDAAQPSLVFEAKDAAGAPITAVTVTMDGAPLTDHLDGSALVVDPGEHKLAFGAAGMAPIEKTIVVQAGEKNRHEVIVLSAPQPVAPPAPPTPPPPPPPPAPSSAPPVPAYVALGVGGAGLVVGVLFTGLWASAKSGGNSACVSQSCTSQTASMWESKQTTDSVLLAVGYGVAAIGAGVGAFLLLSQPKPPPPAAVGVSLRIGLGWAGLEGRFH
jgi:hypothetical protein